MWMARPRLARVRLLPDGVRGGIVGEDKGDEAGEEGEEVDPINGGSPMGTIGRSFRKSIISSPDQALRTDISFQPIPNKEDRTTAHRVIRELFHGLFETSARDTGRDGQKLVIQWARKNGRKADGGWDARDRGQLRSS